MLACYFYTLFGCQCIADYQKNILCYTAKANFLDFFKVEPLNFLFLSEHIHNIHFIVRIGTKVEAGAEAAVVNWLLR